MKKICVLILSIILAVVFVVISVVISIWFIVYPYFSNRINNSTRQGFIDETMSFLSSDEDFIHKYGSPISIDSDNEFPIKNADSEKTEYYMDFTCVTERGTFYIRVYHTWADTWIYSFEEIDMS